MGYLLKEALKTLCGVNQWSYAVFWKIGLQNPKLLIWEEYYHEPVFCSGLPGTENPEICVEDYNTCWGSVESHNMRPGAQAGNKVPMLVNRMMMDNYANVVGEGLIGRAAFTGNHQWILFENFTGEAHPPEVLKEVCQQFSAGMQTVAVVPVLPHGVVQLGSHSAIMENLQFVNDVKNLVHHLGYLPDALLSENYAGNDLAPKNIGVPVIAGNSFYSDLPIGSTKIDPSTSILDSCNYYENSCQTSGFPSQTYFSSGRNQSNIGELQEMNSIPSNVAPHDAHNGAKVNFNSVNSLVNGKTKAEVIPTCPGVNQQASPYLPLSRGDQPSSSASTLNSGSTRRAETQITSDSAMHGLFSSQNALTTNSALFSSSNKDSGTILSVEVNRSCKIANCNMESTPGNNTVSDANRNITYRNPTSSGLPDADSSTMEMSLSDSIDNMTRKKLLKHQSFGTIINATYEDVHVQPLSGDDLYDVLGVDLKNKLLNSRLKNSLSSSSHLHECDWNKNYSQSIKSEGAASKLYPAGQGNSDHDIGSETGGDRLLDAIVSGIHSCPERGSEDDNISCWTTLSSTTCSSAHNLSLPYGQGGALDKTKGELIGFPKYFTNASSCSFASGPSKNDSRTYSQRSSVYESQISSWVEKVYNAKQSNSVSTGYSRKHDEVNKTKRKRLKPGENPRPRPKDRQMIQDRIKELREIVPNGAKCSIDALFERTIKHMIFLQSVTKHADKLKHTGESKIISKDGGLLLKDDDFKGGATWAYEVGLTSIVCPIIVEDLNQPRQMLVEMLCEEGGLFLEIADVIRGLGLTILKGVMESRNDKIWARFAVEAHRDVTRMEIFMSLVRLLEQTAKNAITPLSESSNGSKMVHQLQETGPVPTTCR